MLPVGYVNRCFPALLSSQVNSVHPITVELLLLPAGLDAAPDVTATTPGVQLMHSSLASRVRKSIIRKTPLAPGMRSTQQQQQQRADEAGGDQGHTYRYSYSISTVAAGTSMANMATGGAGDCWLAGISKLGQRRVLLMLSLQEPPKPHRAAFAGLSRTLSTLSRQESLQQEAAEYDDDGLQAEQQQQQQTAGNGAAAAAAEAPFTATVSGTSPWVDVLVGSCSCS
jgi:hypothetical protein